MWSPGHVPLVFRSYTNADSDPAYKPDTNPPAYIWQFNHHLDIIGTDILEPDGNRSVYKWSSDRWNSDQTQLWQVYVKSIGTYSTMEMHYNCTPRDPIRDSAQSKPPSPGPSGSPRIQGAVQVAPTGCTWDGTHVVYLPKGIVRRYQGGKIIEERDANGNATAFAYTTFADGIGQYLSTVTDPVGRSTTYNYAPAYQKCVQRSKENDCIAWKWVYRVSSARDPYGRTATYTNDAASKILSVINAAGKTTSYAYTAGSNFLSSLTNSRGNTTTLQGGYHLADSKWRFTAVTAPGGATTQYAYTVTADANNVYRVFRTLVTNGRGHATTYDMYTGIDSNFFGNLERVTDPLASVTQYAYDARHNLTQMTDPRGNRTTYQYNGRNKVTQIVQATGTLNLTTTLSWDGSDNLLSVTNPRSIRTDFTYNPTHNLTSVKRAAGTADESLTQYTYTSWGGVASLIDPRNNTISFTYTSKRQVQTVTQPVGGTTTYGYDLSTDDQTTVTNGNGRTWTTTYDTARLVTSVKDPLNNIIRHEYDANGNRTRTYDALNQATSFAYDNRDRLTTITDPLSGVTRYEYDPVSNLARISNARTHATTFSYDAVNRLTRVTDALLQATTYGYDAAGNRTSMQDRRGATHSYAYDQVNRLTQMSGGNLTVSYAYDANGNRTSMTDGNGTTNYTYDTLDRLTRTTTPDGRFVAYAYDRSGNRTRLTYPDTTTTLTYAYDAANRLTQITQGTLSWTLAYDPAGNRTAMVQPNGTRTDYAYLMNNWLQSITHKRPDGSAFQSFTYGYDPNGNRTTQTDGTGMTSFTYDPLNRLTAATYPAPYGNWSWVYDAVGNRTSQSAPSGTTTYTYDANNRLTGAGAVNYSYDPNGNLTGTTAGQSFTWDAFNRLTRAVGSGGAVDYRYNGDGLKVRREGPEGGATVYYYDGIRPIWEADGAGALKVQLDRDIFGNLLSRREVSGIRRYFAHDGLGGLTGVSDEAGAHLASLLYDAWGNVRATSGTWTAGNYRFTGAELDSATGLYHMGARFYDPVLGRWLSEDAIQDNFFDPSSLNFYAYVNNNPILFVDPNGEAAAVLVLAGVGVTVSAPAVGAVLLGILIGIGIGVAADSVREHVLMSRASRRAKALVDAVEEALGHLRDHEFGLIQKGSKTHVTEVLETLERARDLIQAMEKELKNANLSKEARAEVQRALDRLKAAVARAKKVLRDAGIEYNI